jgi:hypothetical protein
MIRKSLPAVLLLFALPCFASTAKHHPHHRVTHHVVHHVSTRYHHSHRRSIEHHEVAVQMDPARATQIQEALIKAGYLTGQPTGVWDSNSTVAMQKLQAANGWQTKITPDSRALIKLGLGPKSDTPAPVETAANN